MTAKVRQTETKTNKHNSVLRSSIRLHAMRAIGELNKYLKKYVLIHLFPPSGYSGKNIETWQSILAWKNLALLLTVKADIWKILLNFKTNKNLMHESWINYLYVSL